MLATVAPESPFLVCAPSHADSAHSPLASPSPGAPPPGAPLSTVTTATAQGLRLNMHHMEIRGQHASGTGTFSASRRPLKTTCGRVTFVGVNRMEAWL